MSPRFVISITAIGLGLAACGRDAPAPPAPAPAPAPIATIAAQGAALGQVPFAEVVLATTGKRILPIDPESEVGEDLLEVIGSALDAALASMNSPSSPTRHLRRINEASRFFEDAIAATIDAHPDFTCDYPKTAAGKSQRSGYPDLVITHRASGAVTYLDPKLFEDDSRNSSLRTFYYTPKTKTSKITHDAHHLLAGIEHDGNDGAWRFTRWQLVDLSKFEVRLKTEFQASNRDLYRDSLILRSGGDD